MRISSLLLSLTCLTGNLIADPVSPTPALDPSSVTISGATILNGTAAEFIKDYNFITIQSGNISNYGKFAEGAGYITFFDGTFTNYSGAEFGTGLYGSLTVTSSANLINSGSVAQNSSFFMKSGAITNSGEIASGGNFRIDGGTLDLSSGSKIGSGATEVTISIVPFVNPVSAEIGTQATNITLQNNEFSNSGSIAYGATYLTINNGSFTNTNSLAENLVSDLTISFSEGVNSGIMGSSTSLAFESSTLINSGTVLTNYLSLVNSTITNDGFMQTGGGVLTSNAIEGSGIFQISDGIYSSVPITQGTVYIGTLTQPGSLETQQNVNANVQIIGSESFLLSQNDININNLYSEGKVNPGIAVYNTLTLAGSGTLTETSTYLVDISSNNGPSDRIIANGDFAIQPGAVLNINFPESTFPLPALYTIIQTQNGSITGSFSQINFPDIGGTFQIIYNPTSVQIFTDLDGPGVKNWTGAAKDQFWLDGSNWLDGAIPSIVDTVIFNPQYQSVGNVSLGTGVYSGTPSAAVLEFTPDPGNNFGAYTFIDGQLNLNGTGDGSTLISGGGVQDFSSITLNILNALSYNINASGSYSFGNIISDYAGGVGPSLSFLGDANYAIYGNVGENFSSLNLGTISLQASGAQIGKGAGNIDLTGANLSFSNTKLGENLGNYSVLSSGDLILNGGSLVLSGASEIGSSALGTVSINNLTFNIPNDGRVGYYANKVVLTDATVTNSGILGNGASSFTLNSGSIVNLNQMALSAGTVIINGSFYNAGLAANNVQYVSVSQAFTNDGTFGSGATVINLQDLVNSGVVGGFNSNSSISVGNVVNNYVSQIGNLAETISVSGSVYNLGEFGSNANYISVTSDVNQLGGVKFGHQDDVNSSSSISVGGNVLNEGSYFGYGAESISVGGSVYNSGEFGNYNSSGSITVSGSVNNQSLFGNGIAYIHVGSDVINTNKFAHNDNNNPNCQVIVDGQVDNSGLFGIRIGTVTVGGSVNNTNNFAYDVSRVSVGGDVNNADSCAFAYQEDSQSSAQITVSGGVINGNNANFAYQAGSITIGGSVYNLGIFGRGNTNQQISVAGSVINQSYFGVEAQSISVGDLTNYGVFGSNNLDATISTGNVLNIGSGAVIGSYAGSLTIAGSVYNEAFIGNEGLDVSIASDVKNSGQLVYNTLNAGNSSVSIGGSVANTGFIGFRSGTVTISGSVENVGGDIGYLASYFSVGSDVSNTSGRIAFHDVAQPGVVSIAGNVKNLGALAYFAHSSSSIDISGSVYNEFAFGCNNTSQIVNVTGSVNNLSAFATNAANIIIGGDVINTGDLGGQAAASSAVISIGGNVNNQASLGHYAGSISVAGSVFNQIIFGGDNPNQTVSVAGPVVNNGQFALNALNVSTGDVLNLSSFGENNANSSISVGNVLNQSANARFANYGNNLLVTGSVYNEAVFGFDTQNIHITGDVENNSSALGNVVYFGHQDGSMPTSLIQVDGNVKNVGPSAYFGYGAGSITVSGSVYNEGVFGGNNSFQTAFITSDISNNGAFINNSYSVELNCSNLVNTAAAFNFVADHVNITCGSITNAPTASLANNASILNIDGWVTNEGVIGTGGLVQNVTLSGTFNNLNGATAFSTGGAQMSLTSATISNDQGAFFADGASSIFINSGSITNDGYFGLGASILLTGDVYFENNSVVGEAKKSKPKDIKKPISVSQKPVIAKTTSLKVESAAILETLETQPVETPFIQPTNLGQVELAQEEPIVLVGQASETSYYLNSLISGGKASASTKSEYNFVTQLPQNLQQQAFDELSPQFKVIQFAQEKLDLLLHKELESELYEVKDESRIFVLGGYDRFSQHKQNGFTGYSNNNFYQLIGCVKHFGKTKWLTSIGASESYMKLDPTSSTASYPTVWGSMGVSSQHKGLIYGIDALFGYSFVNTKRHIQVLDQTATSNHGLWNISFEAKVGYRFSIKKTTVKDVESKSFFKKKTQVVEKEEVCAIMPYDTFGYLYGQENSYIEKGTIGNNYQVKNEDISLIRNQLGIKVDAYFAKDYSFFVDGAWVYEYYTNNNIYQAAIYPSNVFGNFSQAIPTKNYGRIQAGFIGDYKHFDWKIAYTGLYGKYLQDSSISLRFGFKF